MKLAGYLLMTLGLMFGALAASTAYHVKVAEIESADIEQGLTLNENVARKNKSNKEPLAKKGEPLTAELVAQLNENEVHTVLVKEFSVGRWKWNWVFLLSMAALIGGAWLLKRSAAMQMAEASDNAKPQDSPAHALQATADGLDELLSQLDQTSQTQDRLRLIVEGVGELQRTHVAAFIDGRDKLVAEFGIGGMAEIMDQFSRAERQINRAWSAACDGHEEEALLSVQTARPLLDAPLEKLQKEDA